MSLRGQGASSSGRPAGLNEDSRLAYLWQDYSLKNDAEKYRQFLTAFIDVYEEYIDVDFSRLSAQRYEADIPRLEEVPVDALPTLVEHLSVCVERLSVSWDQTTLQYASLLLQAVIIYSRNPDTVYYVASADVMRLVIAIAEAVLNKLSRDNTETVSQLVTFLNSSLYYCENLYDPYHTWRIALRGWTVDKSSIDSKLIIPLHVQFVPFFYECFQKCCLDVEVQMRLFHVFGAVMSASQDNALKVICPAMVDVLYQVLLDTRLCGPAASSKDATIELKKLVLHSAATLIHILHRAAPDQRQVEVGAVIDGYFRSVVKLTDNESNSQLQILMLDKVCEILSQHSELTASLQHIFISAGICEQLKVFLTRISIFRTTSSELAAAAIRVLHHLLYQSSNSKEAFLQGFGYEELLKLLQRLGQPSRSLLNALYDMMVEERNSNRKLNMIRNSDIATLLVQWLPCIESRELQVMLARLLLDVISANSWSRFQCCQRELSSTICSCLMESENLAPTTIGLLLNMLQSTGSTSVTGGEMKKLLKLLKQTQLNRTQPRGIFWCKLVHVISKMAGSLDSKNSVPHSYFDFQADDAGLLVRNVGRWLGSGFTFHAWVCLESHKSSSSAGADVSSSEQSESAKRRQLYSILTSSGSGFEAFLTAESVLVVSVCTKKESFDIPVLDCPVADGKWHCIDVVHQTSKRPFGQSQLFVYVDEVLQINAQLKFPSLGEDISVCRIGCGSLKPAPHLSASTSLGSAPDWRSRRGIPSSFTDSEISAIASGKSTAAPAKSGGFWSRMSLKGLSRGGSVADVGGPAPGEEVNESACGRFGVAVSLNGCLSDVIIFTEALLDTQIQALHRLGSDRQSIQLEDGAVPADLPYKPLLHYHPLASEGATCYDLSSNGLNAELCTNSRVCVRKSPQDVINELGGVRILFALLESVAAPDSSADSAPVDFLTSSPQKVQKGPASPGSPGSPGSNQESLEEILNKIWPQTESDSGVERSLLKNPVSCLVVLLRSFVIGSVVNQESLVRDDSVAVLGLLLQKVEPHLLDNSFHDSLKLFVDDVTLLATPSEGVTGGVVTDTNQRLLNELQRHVLFDWRIWCRCHLSVCFTHVQYLLTIVKNDRKHYRKRFGVQCILDIIRLHYGLSLVGKARDDLQMILRSLTGVIKFYVGKEITFEELSQILAFICSVRNEHLVCEVLDLLISLLELPGKRDQIYLLMYEPGMGELLYVLLTHKDFSVDLKEKILKIITLLLKTDKVYERSKARLRLLDSNLYPGLISLMVDTLPSVYMTRNMLEQVFIAESAASINASLYIIQTLSLCDVTVKVEAVRQLMKVLLSKPNIPKLFARQVGWQAALIRLFILRPTSGPATKRFSSSFDSGSMEIHSIVSPPSETPANPTTLWNPADRLIDIEEGQSLGVTPVYEDDENSSANKFSMFSDFLSDPYQLDNDTIRSSTTQNSASQWRHRDSDTSDGPVVKSSRSLSVSSRTSSQSGAGEILASSLTSSDWRHARLGSGDSEADPESLASAVKRMGLHGLTVSRTRKDSESGSADKEEELCQNLLVTLFTIMWRGVDSSDDKAWQERGQVFAAIGNVSEENELLVCKTELYRKLLELLIQGCIMDIREQGATHIGNCKNSLQLMKLTYHFLTSDSGPPQHKFSEQLIEDLLAMLDLLLVWQVGNEWLDMERIGLSCLLTFSAHDDLDLCSIATARLHTLVQTRPVEKLQESCYILGYIDDIIRTSVNKNTDQYNFLIPVMKALLEKCDDMLNISTYLPQLISLKSKPSFADDFRQYCLGKDWSSFISRQVTPSRCQYQTNIYEGLGVEVKSFMGGCQELMMINAHRRDREKAEAKNKFQEDFISAFRARVKSELIRLNNVKQLARSQNQAVSREWKIASAFFSSERGTWCHEERVVGGGSGVQQYFKLSSHENQMRMRPKLIPNPNFDPHLEASRLRDNQGADDLGVTNLLALSLVKEVKVSTASLDDDRLEDEDWNLIANQNTQLVEDVTGKEKVVLSEDCELITITEVIQGRLEVTTSNLYFTDLSAPGRGGGGTDGGGSSVPQDMRCALDELREIHFRRYNLRRSALEIFLLDQTNYFINFQQKVRNKVYSRIVSLRPPNLIYNQSRSPAELLKSSSLTQKWVDREISNFEYLMRLNTIAGRTYNDLSQYPVFPWILSDYTSSTLNLEDPSVYRDLSLPIGIVNPKHEKDVREKYESFEDPTGIVEKFHYGTHYSNPAGVMHYLLRIEPFTSLHIQLQSGRFDVADRQFHSIPAAWQGLMENGNDVKELIPEFFYLPEFLLNMNDFDLGVMQILKERVDDVILPPWSTSPYDFIKKHREALESDHVSKNLHNWIDLIFGYKQRGPAAVEALNVFYYCTYEGAVDLDTVTDVSKRKALEGMINNFGQTPCQLLKEPHPRRLTSQELLTRSLTSKIDRPIKIFSSPQQLKSFCVEAAPLSNPLAFVSVPPNQIRSFMQQAMSDTMVAITQDGTLFTHGWLPYDKSITNFFTFEKDPSVNNHKARKKLAGLFNPGTVVTSKLFAVSHDAKIIISVGHWDLSIRVYSIQRSKQIAQLTRHTDVVTCVALDSFSTRMITGSADTTCIIWSLTSQAGQTTGVNSRPLHILCGHEAAVSSVVITSELDMAVSSSKDGTVMVHSVKTGEYLRTLRPSHEKGWTLSVDLLSLSDLGHICVYCTHTPPGGLALLTKMTLHLYTVNGKHLSKESIQSPITDMCISDGHLISANSDGIVNIRNLHGLASVASVTLHSPITCITVTNSSTHILAALSDSHLIVIAVKKQPEAK